MRILIFGDSIGVPQLLQFLQEENIVGIVGATIRSQSNYELAELSVRRNIGFLIQPRSNSEDYESFVASVRCLKPDLVLVNSYSMIIREEVLSASRLGGINLHAGLLPRNRGCNPTQWAIINKQFVTGVTMHEMDSGIDTGPIIDQKKIPIFFHDTWLDIRGREAQATNDLLKSNLPQILSGSWQAVAQKNKNASTGRRRTSKDGEFFWSEKIVDIHNKIRALVPPLPPAFYLRKDGKKVEHDKYLTPWELTSLKYDPEVGGGV
jgi:methionyl-tRNA formyltransferase